MEAKRHPNDGDLYTPITPQLMALIVRMRQEHGTWSNVCAVSKTKKRVLRKLYKLEIRAVSMTLLDRLCTTTEVGSVGEFPWFTAEDLVALGIWDELFGDRDERRRELKNRRARRRRQLKKERARLMKKERTRSQEKEPTYPEIRIVSWKFPE